MTLLVKQCENYIMLRGCGWMLIVVDSLADLRCMQKKCRVENETKITKVIEETGCRYNARLE
jgi:hypothetical protein